MHVKVEISDAIHKCRMWYDRYVEPTLSLRDLIKREYALFIYSHNSSEVTHESCELVLDNERYSDRYPGSAYNINDSVQNYNMIYLTYGKKIIKKNLFAAHLER